MDDPGFELETTPLLFREDLTPEAQFPLIAECDCCHERFFSSMCGCEAGLKVAVGENGLITLECFECGAPVANVMVAANPNALN